MSDTPDSPVPPAPTSNLGRNLAVASVVAVLLYAGMLIYGDVGELQGEMGDYSWSMFALGVALATANYGIRFLRWQYYLARLGIEKVPWVESLRIFVAGFVMSVTPGKVGEVLKSVLLFESRGVAIARTAPIVIAERLTDLMALVLLAAAGSLAFSEGWIVALGGALVVAVLWLACAWRPLGEWCLRVAAKLPVLGRIAPKLREAYEALRELTAPAPLAAATLLSVVSWGLECLSLLYIAAGFADLTLTLEEATFSYSAPTIVGALALLPGGLGVTEAGMASLVARFGETSEATAVATTILVRLATLWWAVVLGAFALVWHRRALASRRKAL